MLGESALTVDDHDWMSVSALATERSVTRQAISERVQKLAKQGRLPVRGERKKLRVHAPTFRRLVEQQHDPAQDLRLRHVKADLLTQPPAAPEPIAEQPPRVDQAEAPAREKAPRQPTAFDDAATREKNARAAIAEMDAERRRGELVPAREFEAAAVEVGTRVAQTINALRSHVTPLYAAAQKGEDALHAALHIIIDNALRQIADDMSAIAHKALEQPARD